MHTAIARRRRDLTLRAEGARVVERAADNPPPGSGAGQHQVQLRVPVAAALEAERLEVVAAGRERDVADLHVAPDVII